MADLTDRQDVGEQVGGSGDSLGVGISQERIRKIADSQSYVEWAEVVAMARMIVLLQERVKELEEKAEWKEIG